ncbi:MAG: hypothetical protein CHACPFDD_00558 [Phycisphaerae bacterium]|nr:hypothetical protein [Phycisphaerae bacterium]
MTSLIILALLASGPSRADKTEIQARDWFNNPVFRIHDDRRVLLFFFECADPKAGRTAARLNKLVRRGDLVVIGLTADDADDAKRFIARHKVKFTVGARSRSAKQFGCERLPTLRLLTRGDDEPIREIDDARIAVLYESDTIYGPYGNEDISGLTTADELRDFVQSAAEGNNRAAATWKLRRVSAPAEFQSFAAERLAEETDPWVRGVLRYLLSNPSATEPDQPRSPSATYAVDYGGNPDDPKWSAVRSLRIGEASDSAQLRDLYAKHSSDTPTDVLVRRQVVERMGSIADRALAREQLLYAVRSDADPSIRMIAAMRLGELCQPGDVETADLLDEIGGAEREPLRVRPMVEYVAEYLRTGIEDTRHMTARP